jgi:hypothetical protein
LTMDEIAAKFGIEVSKLKIQKWSSNKTLE